MTFTRTNRKPAQRTDTSEARRLGVSTLAAVTVAAAVALASPQAYGQTGGTTGTTSGTLTKDDVFIGIQRVKGENLNEVNRAKFLNNASCRCKRPAWIKAVINASSLAKSAQVPAGDSVLMYLGTSCDNSTVNRDQVCRKLASTVMSDFRANGMLVPTSVDVLSKQYSVNVPTTGSGGSSGTGGAGGAGGAGGSTSTTTDDTDPSGCDAVGDMFSQTVWLFIESSAGARDALSMGTGIVIDAAPPPTPTNFKVAPANEALIASWTAVDKTTTSDLAGYQVFCARRGNEQVFLNGTFTTYVDTCGGDPADDPQLPITDSATFIADRNTNFICSDLLSVADTSFRIKILENAITYAVGVAAVDSHGNASKMIEMPGTPIQTTDFYNKYRSGDPQGAAVGGACAVGGPASGADAATLAGLTLLGLTLAGRRRRAAQARRPSQASKDQS